MLAYQILLEPDDNGTFLVTAPAFPEVTTFGEAEADCVANGRDAIEEAIGARIASGRDIPPPVDLANGDGVGEIVKIPLLISLKAYLQMALRAAGITRAELARRLDWNRESVDRLFRLDHRTRLEQFDAAFHALGREIDVTMREAA